MSCFLLHTSRLDTDLITSSPTAPDVTASEAAIPNLRGHCLWFACDHAGRDLQKELMARARQAGAKTISPQETSAAEPSDQTPLVQPDSPPRAGQGSIDHPPSIDYPCVVPAVAEAVAAQKGYGVLICGSGVGMSIAANRFPGVRAVLALTPDLVTLARAHNDANTVAIGARHLTPEGAWRCLLALCLTPFEGGRHVRRVQMLDALPSFTPESCLTLV